MQRAMERVHCGEVTFAVRDTTINDVSVQAGDIIGLLNGKLIAANQSVDVVVRTILDAVDLDGYELVTFFYGANLPQQEAESLIEELADEYDSLEMDLIYGGQPHYHLIFSIE
jgi:dihydroxyacetone kinase-like predicted kinase